MIIKRIFYLFSLITFLTSCQDTVTLKWKIDQNEKVSYYTSYDMKEGGLNKMFTELNTFAGKDLDSLKNWDRILSKLFVHHEKSEQYFVLGKDKDNSINVKLIKDDVHKTLPDDSKEHDFFTSVLMRGKINRDGTLNSFYIDRNEKNVLSLFFGLPDHEISVGDVWKSNVDLLSMDPLFNCTQSNKENKVELTKIEVINGIRYATLQYHIVEFVEGNFGEIGTLVRRKSASNVKVSFNGEGVFCVDKGRWTKYDGKLNVVMNGLMHLNTNMDFTLNEVHAVPTHILAMD